MTDNLFLEIQKEYTACLVDLLNPLIYDGIQSIYNNAVSITKTTKKPNELFVIFQKLLIEVSKWNQQLINNELNRIIQMTNSSAYFEKLVKVVIKCRIILLTYSNNMSKQIADKFYDRISVADFVHLCYIECAREANNHPYFYYTDADEINGIQYNIELKRNKMQLTKLYNKGINRAIHRMVPMTEILEEFLENTQVLFNIPQQPVTKVEKLLDYNQKIESAHIPALVNTPISNIMANDHVKTTTKYNTEYQNKYNIKLIEEFNVQ